MIPLRILRTRPLSLFSLLVSASLGCSALPSDPIGLQVTEVDENGDGVSDQLGTPIDANGDGNYDLIDINGDGTPDGIAIDTDGDGVADAAGVDTDGDGIIDGLDLNGDGVVDVITDSSSVAGTGGSLAAPPGTATGGGNGSGGTDSGGPVLPPLSPGPVTGSWSVASGSDNLAGLSIFTDHHTDPTSPPMALVDNDNDSTFVMYRVQDYDFRINLATPAVVSAIEIVQAWDDWGHPTGMRITNAAGESADITLGTGRDPQQMALGFTKPTDFIDVVVNSSTLSGKAGSWAYAELWGGLAEVRLKGKTVAATGAPTISTPTIVSSADGISVAWRTDVPATSQVSFRDDAGLYWIHGDGGLRNDHVVLIDGGYDVNGLLLLRSTSGQGRSTEFWDDSLANGGKIAGRPFLFGQGVDHEGEANTNHGSSAAVRNDKLRNDYVTTWLAGELANSNGWRQWLPEWLNEARTAGFQPQLFHWFFGDHPQRAQATSQRSEYLNSVRDMDNMIRAAGFGADAVVTLEPEYNSPGGDVADWEGWNDLIIDAINIIKQGSGAQVCVYAGWWDFQNFVPISLGRAALHADCASFAKMAASTDGTASPRPGQSMEAAILEKATNAVSDASRFTHYLRRKTMLPVRWDFWMVSDYGGWSEIQRDAGTEFCNRLPELRANGLMAAAWMSYQDSGLQRNIFYGEAEKHKGIVNSSGSKKPNIWDIWNQCGGL